MAAAAGRQLGVLLALLRNRGLWQVENCHNPRSDNADDGLIAITPERPTPERREPEDGGGRKPELRAPGRRGEKNLGPPSYSSPRAARP